MVVLYRSDKIVYNDGKSTQIMLDTLNTGTDNGIKQK